MERCLREIAAIEAELRAGNPDVAGLLQSARSQVLARDPHGAGTLEIWPRERGVQELRQAMKDPAEMPLAISMLGVEHLKAGQLDAALTELDQAVHLLPGRPENHANLAYALFSRRSDYSGWAFSSATASGTSELATSFARFSAHRPEHRSTPIAN